LAHPNTRCLEPFDPSETPAVVIGTAQLGQRGRFAGDSFESVFRIIMHLPFIRTGFDGFGTYGGQAAEPAFGRSYCAGSSLILLPPFATGTIQTGVAIAAELSSVV